MRLPDLATADPQAPRVRLRWRRGCSLRTAYEVSDGRYRRSTRGGGSLEVDREQATVSCVLPRDVSPAAMVHPLLSMPLSFLATWAGAATLHGGAFVRGGRAWVVCGEPEAGKSTTLAALAARGVPVLADDLSVVEGDDVVAGPRCVDLRADVAARTPAARSIGVVAGRERFRLPLGHAPARAPLGGIVVLGWGAQDGLRALRDAGDRLRLLHSQHYAVRLGPMEPQHAFALLEVPMWRLERDPAAASGPDETVDQLLSLAGD